MYVTNGSRRRFSSKGAALGSVVISILATFGCERLSPEEKQARASADSKRLATVQIPPDMTFSSGRIERVRPTTVVSSTLLFWESNTSRIFKLDTTNNTLNVVALDEWDKATGPISDFVQIGLANGQPSHNKDLAKIFGGDPKQDYVGEFVVENVTSPTRTKLAVVSANGTFHPQRRGWIGGHNAYVEGPHYLEIRDAKTGVLQMPAVSIPGKSSPQIWWTADERFLVCLWYDDRLMVVPTGFEAAPFLADPKKSYVDFAIFQPAGWWDGWVHPNTFEVRYESIDCTALLMSTGPGGSVYRYDPAIQALVPSSGHAWDRATGPRFGPKDIFPPDPPRLTSEEEDRRRDKMIERLNAGLEAEDLPQIDRQVKVCERMAKTEGHRRKAYFPAPSKRRVLIVSENAEEDENYFLEFFEPRFCQKVGRTIEMPKTTWKALGDMFWLPDCRYVLFEDYDYRYFTILHGDRLINPHPGVDIGRD